MLAEERMEEIVRLVQQYGSMTVQKLMEYTGASESTLRRDLNALDKRGMLTKVHGGAIALEMNVVVKDSDVILREELHREEKIEVARYAASLIRPNDFVYLDAGTTTGYLIDFLKEKRAVFVTNGVMHARKLVQKGYTVYLPGGEFKAVTEALIGEMAIQNLQKYHFTRGFWGTNGIDSRYGFTTPDAREAQIKQCSMEQTEKCYILSDSSKIGKVSCVTFRAFEDARMIVAGDVPQEYKKYKHMIHV